MEFQLKSHIFFAVSLRLRSASVVHADPITRGCILYKNEDSSIENEDSSIEIAPGSSNDAHDATPSASRVAKSFQHVRLSAKMWLSFSGV